MTGALALSLAAGLVAGAAAAALFLLALQRSIARLPGRAQVLGTLVGGALTRVAFVLAVFATVIHWGHWPALAAALVGFVSVRMAWLGRVRRGIAAEPRAGAPR